MSDRKLNELKPTPFWIDNPVLWFAQTEAQFGFFNVKDDLTKFYYIISQLDKHCLTTVKGIVLSPPAAKKYETLKTELLSKLKESNITKIKEILKDQQVGNRKPSEFLRYLKDLAGEDFEEEFIKSVWTSRLPDKVQWVSSFLTSSSLEKIAQLADLAMNSPTMNSLDRKSQSTKPDIKNEIPDDNCMKELAKRIDELTVTVKDMAGPSKTQPISSKSTATTKTASTLSLFSQSSTYKTKKVAQDSYIICWYHAQFGWAAMKCDQPCHFALCSLALR